MPVGGHRRRGGRAGRERRRRLPCLPPRALSAEPHRVVLFAFDLLHLDGKDLRKLSLVDRREALEKLLGIRKPNSPLQLSEAIEGSGAEVFKAADQLGLEGIVSKRKASRYESGASQAWLKTKCMVENEFVVVGVEPNPGGPPFALLAREEDGALTYAGSAFVTLADPARDRFWQTAESSRLRRPLLRKSAAERLALSNPNSAFGLVTFAARTCYGTPA